MSERARESGQDEDVVPGGRGTNYLVAHVGGKHRLVAIDSIYWIEGSGNYARLHCPEGKFLVRVPLVQLERDLADRGFVRVHRGALVPLREFRELVSRGSRGAHLELRSGFKVRVNRAFQLWMLSREESGMAKK